MHWLRALIWPISLGLVTAGFVLSFREAAAGKKFCADFICFWSAAQLIASGDNPYDAANQTRVQQQHGWDVATDGQGRYAYVPYYYPPWLALAFTPLLPLDFETARLTWLVLNLQLLVLTGYLMRRSVAGLSAWVPIVLVLVFMFSIAAAFLGQLTPLIMFLIAAVWRLLKKNGELRAESQKKAESGEPRAESQMDSFRLFALRSKLSAFPGSSLSVLRSPPFLAGLLLAFLLFKPQLTAILVLALLVWSARQGRYAVLGGFVLGLGLLLAVGSLLVPSWPWDAWQALQVAPLVTSEEPWFGVSWQCLLRTGFFAWTGDTGMANSWLLGSAYAVVAVPMLLLVLWSAVCRWVSLQVVISLSLLSVFFVAPYARAYDLPILLIPALFLLNSGLPKLWGASLVVLIVFAPYVQLILMPLKNSVAIEAGFFWIPLVLLLSWSGALVGGVRRPAPSAEARAERSGERGASVP